VVTEGIDYMNGNTIPNGWGCYMEGTRTNNSGYRRLVQ